MATLTTGPRVRDPERTQERILEAALGEFSAKGFAGARVDEIARVARVNKRMLYHYFGNKHGLFRAVLVRKIHERSGWADTAPLDPEDNLVFWFDLMCRDPEWVRLLQWEGLQRGNSPLVAGRERREAFARAIARFRKRQAEGHLAPDLDVRHTMLTLMAVTTFPLAFPQITRLVTGSSPTESRFQREHAVFLRRLARALRGSARGDGVPRTADGRARSGDGPGQGRRRNGRDH